MAKRKHSKKMRKVMGVLGPIVAVILTILVAVLLIKVLGMNIIPDKYLIFLGLVVLIVVIFDVFLFIPKIKWQIKTVFSIISLPLIALSIFGIIKINDTIDFFKKISAVDYEVEQYYVMVLNNSGYKDIKDLAKKDVGVFPTEAETYSKAIELFDKEVSADEVEYKDVLKMATDLVGKKVDAIILSDAHKGILEDEYEAFVKNAKVLYTIEVKTELEDIGKNVKVTKESFTVYISGIDTYGKISTRSRSDVNMLMTINPVTHEILLTNIPRDYYVQLHGTTGLKDKLTHAGVYGINKSIETIEDFMGVDINYYFRVNFNTLITLVDTVGGITIDSDASFTPWTDYQCKIKKGKNDLNGKCALAFARERHAYLEGDRHRGENQQQVISKLIDKLTTSKTLISKYSEILDTLEGSFQTSLSGDEMSALIKMQLNDMPKWTIINQAVTGSDLMAYTYSYANQKLYVMVPDQKTIDAANLKIKELLNKEVKEG